MALSIGENNAQKKRVMPRACEAPLCHEGYNGSWQTPAGKDMKVAGSFPDFKFCYEVDQIRDQIIYIKQYACEPPYDTFRKNSYLAFRNGKIVEVQ